MEDAQISHISSPVGCAADWQSQQQLSPSTVDDWLLHTGSLTERLKQHCQSFEVQVQSEQAAVLSACEKQLLSNEHNYIAREVLLYCDQQPWVFARSLLPEKLVEQRKQLANLGSKPLGSILFNDPNIQRAPFQIARFAPNTPIALFTEQLSYPVETSLWGRRSLFTDGEYQLMVAEIFLPASPLYP